MRFLKIIQRFIDLVYVLCYIQYFTYCLHPINQRINDLFSLLKWLLYAQYPEKYHTHVHNPKSLYFCPGTGQGKPRPIIIPLNTWPGRRTHVGLCFKEMAYLGDGRAEKT